MDVSITCSASFRLGASLKFLTRVLDPCSVFAAADALHLSNCKPALMLQLAGTRNSDWLRIYGAAARIDRLQIILAYIGWHV